MMLLHAPPPPQQGSGPGPQHPSHAPPPPQQGSHQPYPYIGHPQGKTLTLPLSLAGHFIKSVSTF